jgi:hypothetical protein
MRAKVGELMVLCDELESALAFSQDGRDRLLDSLLHEALSAAADGTTEPTLVTSLNRDQQSAQ